MKKSLKRIISIAAITLSLAACGPKRPIAREYTVYQTPVDQVMEDHNGVRIRWTDGTGQWKERKIVYRTYNSQAKNACKAVPLPDISEDAFRGYNTNSVRNVVVYSDLESQRGYARTASWAVELAGICGGAGTYDNPHAPRASYTEIHLPKSEKVSPGHDSYRVGKQTIVIPMREISP